MMEANLWWTHLAQANAKEHFSTASLPSSFPAPKRRAKWEATRALV